MKQKHGVNPATFRVAGNDIAVTMVRLGMGTADKMKHTVTVAIVNEKTKKPLGVLAISEDKFISGLGYLFPRGELDGANLSPDPEDSGDLRKELGALKDLTRDGYKPFPSKSAYYTAMARIERIKEIFEELDKQ